MIHEIMHEIQGILYSADLDYNAYEFSATVVVIGLGLATIAGMLLLPQGWIAPTAAFFVLGAFLASVYALLMVMANKRVALIEELLPDFLSIISSNIRSGLTYDRALLLSARKEFGPLAREVDRAAKEAISGKSLPEALMGMTTRVRSESFAKTIRLIVEGIRSGGKLAELLEATSQDLRRFSSVRKDVTATVMVYQLFMLAAAALAGPLLYAVMVILVQTTSVMKSRMVVSPDAAAYLPLGVGASSFSPEFAFLFSIAGIAITGVFSCFAAGVVSKGRESEGYSYVPIVLAVGLLIFFVAKTGLELLFTQFSLA